MRGLVLVSLIGGCSGFDLTLAISADRSVDVSNVTIDGQPARDFTATYSYSNVDDAIAHPPTITVVDGATTFDRTFDFRCDPHTGSSGALGYSMVRDPDGTLGFAFGGSSCGGWQVVARTR